VGSAKVEAAVLALRKEREGTAADGSQQEPTAGSSDTSASSKPSATVVDHGTDRKAIALRFVEEMGGLAAARDALDELESSLNKIMK
jgi:hypothetical protein